MIFHQTKNNNGFTLIELLVVVSIISLLSSVVFASVTSARAKAIDAKALSELKSITTAINLFINDYGVYPGTVSSSPIFGWYDVNGFDTAGYPDFSSIPNISNYIKVTNKIAEGSQMWYQKLSDSSAEIMFVPKDTSLLNKDQDCETPTTKWYCINI